MNIRFALLLPVALGLAAFAGEPGVLTVEDLDKPIDESSGVAQPAEAAEPSVAAQFDIRLTIVHDVQQHINRILHHAQNQRPAGHAEPDVEFQHLPAVFVPDRRDLNRPVKIGFLKPGQERMQQSVRDAVFVLRVPFHQSAERRARHDAEIAVEGAFIFLIRH